MVVWGSGSGIGREAKDGFAPGRLSWWEFGCIGDVAGGDVGCEDELTQLEGGLERDVLEHGRWAGGNIRATASPRAWELWASERGGDESWERAQQQREGVCEWRPRNALCKEQ